MENVYEYDLSDAEEAVEYLEDCESIDELFEKTKHIPAGVLAEEQITKVVGWYLYVSSTVSTESLKVYASTLNLQPDWNRAVSNALDTFSSEGRDEGFDGVMEFYQRIVSVVPTYLVGSREFIEGTVRSLHRSKELPRLAEALTCIDVDLLFAFSEHSLESFYADVWDAYCRDRLRGIVTEIIKYALDRELTTSALQQAVSCFWWEQIMAYADDRSGFLWDVRRDGAKDDDECCTWARTVVKFILNEEGS